MVVAAVSRACTFFAAGSPPSRTSACSLALTGEAHFGKVLGRFVEVSCLLSCPINLMLRLKSHAFQEQEDAGAYRSVQELHVSSNTKLERPWQTCRRRPD